MLYWLAASLLVSTIVRAEGASPDSLISKSIVVPAARSVLIISNGGETRADRWGASSIWWKRPECGLYVKKQFVDPLLPLELDPAKDLVVQRYYQTKNDYIEHRGRYGAFMRGSVVRIDFNPESRLSFAICANPGNDITAYPVDASGIAKAIGEGFNPESLRGKATTN